MKLSKNILRRLIKEELSKVVFDDSGMEGAGGGLARNGVHLASNEHQELYDYYYHTSDAGEEFWKHEGFMEYLNDLGYTHFNKIEVDLEYKTSIERISDYYLG